jgi:hypothetical protein
MTDGYPSEEWTRNRLDSVQKILDGLLQHYQEINNLISKHESEKEVLRQLLKTKMVKNTHDTKRIEHEEHA